MVMARNAYDHASDRLYKAKGEQAKHEYTMTPDVPAFIQAKMNAYNISENYYKSKWLEDQEKGHNLNADAIPIRVAKASRDIASDYKYKQAFEKQKGHHIGALSMEDDPKLVHSMKVAKIQSEREYKKAYEKEKTKYHTPLDMMNVELAKKAQNLASNFDYKHLIHQYRLPPDNMTAQQAKMAYGLRSDIAYRSDLEWMREGGWIPLGSMEHKKVQRAAEILSEKKYRQHPSSLEFTSVPDSPDLVQAKINSKNLNDVWIVQHCGLLRFIDRC
uniref:Nebulin n=1 Tax=Eptatretus burgeri TaxID=7764 RepID=A0A8C4QU15_EPTBU